MRVDHLQALGHAGDGWGCLGFRLAIAMSYTGFSASCRGLSPVTLTIAMVMTGLPNVKLQSNWGCSRMSACLLDVGLPLRPILERYMARSFTLFDFLRETPFITFGFRPFQLRTRKKSGPIHGFVCRMSVSHGGPRNRVREWVASLRRGPSCRVMWWRWRRPGIRA